jgi:hypothetical protein
VTGRWFSPGTPVSSTNKTDNDYITEILLKVGLNTINLLIAILFIFPLMFKTDIFHIMWAHDMIPIIANR